MRGRGAATTRTVLLSALLLLVAALTGASLLIVWHRMGQQVTADFTRELNRSALAFADTEAERLNALQRVDALLADLPSLKALMTTNDDRTIEDGAMEYYRTSGNDLFALTGSDYRVRAAYAKGLVPGSSLSRDLAEALKQPQLQYLISGEHLFRFAVAPVYFGRAESGTLLGYVVTGYAVDAPYLAQLSNEADADRAFLSRDRMLGSSRPMPLADAAKELQAVPSQHAGPMFLHGERYLAVSRDLSHVANAPLRLVLFRSLQEPEREIHDISRLLLIVGFSIVLLGSILMMFVARWLTQPLEELTRRVRLFGAGEGRRSAYRTGTREVRQLADDFEAMKERLERSNRARLESERLATIGSMASSVSHDLRHYLASIYANAEFLASMNASERERAEFLEDIRVAVLGTTEMLESLMIFGRTGQSIQHAPERLDELTRRAVAQVRTHPDAAGVLISVEAEEGDLVVVAEGKQLQRALYNLLLNGCQSARMAGPQPAVTARVARAHRSVVVQVKDNGVGIPETMHPTIFDPFVSEGKQNGTGLGLTLCRCIAAEHEGEVRLVSSAPGSTIFELRLPRIGFDDEPEMPSDSFKAEVQFGSDS